MRWTRQRRARRVRRAGHSVSDHRARQTTALKRLRSSFDGTGTKPIERLFGGVADGEVVWSWHPLLVSSLAEVLAAQPGTRSLSIREAMVAKRNSSPGRARSKPLKPLRAGMPGDFRCLRCEHPCATFTTQRVRGCGCTGRPAFPTPSFQKGEKVQQNLGRAAPRDARTRISGGLSGNEPQLPNRPHMAVIYPAKATDIR
jgi:hypothetical protein